MATNSFVAAIDSLPFIVKLLLALPLIDGFVYGIYRILKGNLIIGILWIFFGAAILWIVDIVCILLYKKVTVFA